mmetsp:Transcript_19253/g.46497  ORF Transcript_19253/g.46497 Transcript_19253/m.46497 type:complete len:379 (+) Transcript_19253:490-1626(+)
MSGPPTRASPRASTRPSRRISHCAGSADSTLTATSSARTIPTMRRPAISMTPSAAATTRRPNASSTTLSAPSRCTAASRTLGFGRAKTANSPTNAGSADRYTASTSSRTRSWSKKAKSRRTLWRAPARGPPRTSYLPKRTRKRSSGHTACASATVSPRTARPSMARTNRRARAPRADPQAGLRTPGSAPTLSTSTRPCRPGRMISTAGLRSRCLTLSTSRDGTRSFRSTMDTPSSLCSMNGSARRARRRIRSWSRQRGTPTGSTSTRSTAGTAAELRTRMCDWGPRANSLSSLWWVTPTRWGMASSRRSLTMLASQFAWMGRPSTLPSAGRAGASPQRQTLRRTLPWQPSQTYPRSRTGIRCQGTPTGARGARTQRYA